MRFTKVAFAASAMFAALLVPRQLAAQVVDGSGTTNVIPRWIDTNTLGNSHISDIGGVVTVTGKNGTAGTNSDAPAALMVTGGSGAGRGAGGGIQLTSGRGARPSPLLRRTRLPADLVPRFE